MAEPTIAQQLQYARLQMASEAFLVNEKTNTLQEDLGKALVDGNFHASAK